MILQIARVELHWAGRMMTVRQLRKQHPELREYQNLTSVLEVGMLHGAPRIKRQRSRAGTWMYYVGDSPQKRAAMYGTARTDAPRGE